MSYMSDEQLVLTTCYKLGIPYEGEGDTSETVAKVRRVVHMVQASERAQIEGGALPPYILSAVMEKRQAGTEWSTRLSGNMLSSTWVRDQHKIAYRDTSRSNNEMYAHPLFRILVPVSGGLDSTALYHMALSTGREVVPVYVQAGQEYEGPEIDALASLGIEPHKIQIPPPEKGTGSHIIFGRNARVIEAIAAYAHSEGWWGELWFGNVMGESHVVGNDKSSRFMNGMQAILFDSGYEVRIVNPLIGLTKADIVAWYVQNGYEEMFHLIRPCVGKEGRVCGACSTCAKFVLACEYNDIDWSLFFPPETPAAIASYLRRKEASMVEEPDRYTHRHIQQTLAAIESLRAKGVI